MKFVLIFLAVLAISSAVVLPELPSGLPEISADEADLLQKIIQNPSMMKLMTHPKTVEAMEEIAAQTQSTAQQTEDRTCLLLLFLLAQAITSLAG